MNQSTPDIESITSPEELDCPLLKAFGVRAGYGKSEIIHSVDIGVNECEIVSIIGPNGAGKSTLLKAIIGAVTVTNGTITLKGEDITSVRPHELASYGLAYAPQGDTIFPQMNVDEHLNMGGWTINDLESRKEFVLDLFPRLQEMRSKDAKAMSGGEQQMLSLARTLMVDPDLLVLDEPSIGLAPSIVDDILESIQEIRDLGASILVVEQDAVRSLKVSDRGYVLESGELRFEGPSDALLDDESVRNLYLGL